MSALDKSPINPNYLSAGGFKVLIDRAPELDFFAQKVNIPDLSIAPTGQPNPFVVIPHSGDHIDYDPLSITFKVDEDMRNWLAMHNWIKGLGFPNEYREYRELKTSATLGRSGIESDIKVFLLTSHRNPNIEVTFRNAFPIHLSGLDFDSTLTDVEYLQSTVSFKYVSYAIETRPF